MRLPNAEPNAGPEETGASTSTSWQEKRTTSKMTPLERLTHDADQLIKKTAKFHKRIDPAISPLYLVNRESGDDLEILRLAIEIRSKGLAISEGIFTSERRELEIGLSPEEINEAVIATLETRFGTIGKLDYSVRDTIHWGSVAAALRKNPKAIAALQKMEQTGGQPTLINVTEECFVFCDWCDESPGGERGNLAFDREAAKLYEEENGKPIGNAKDLAASWGARLPTVPEHLSFVKKKKAKRNSLYKKSTDWLEPFPGERDKGMAQTGSHRGKTKGRQAHKPSKSRGFRCIVEVARV